MKLTATEGCVCYSYEIDGIAVADLLNEESEHYNPTKVKDAIIKMLELPESEDKVYCNIFQNLITQLGSCNFEFNCEECGDDVYSYELEV